MKPITFIALLLTASIAPLRSEENVSTLPADSGARILGKIPDGTPPPPQPPKPKFEVASKDILQSAAYQQGGRTVTIQKIQPLALPPPPIPVKPVTVELDEETSRRFDEYRKAHPATRFLMLGATVFHFNDSPPRTLVRYWPPGKGKSVAFWSSVDFALIAGGIQSFADGAGRNNVMWIGWGNAKMGTRFDLQKGPNNRYGAPPLPEFASGPATFEDVGDQLTAEEVAPIQAIHDLYNKNYEQLKSAYEGRERSRLEHEAWVAANPQQPKDITLNYWRTKTPPNPQKGGAAR